jgi:DNA-directed RNA polymerase subunit RPC12/RpoP
MQTVATLDPTAASDLAEFLKKQGIPHETRAIVEESGIESAEVVVADEDYEKACQAAEQWGEALSAAAEKRRAIRCADCGSPRIEQRRVDEGDSITKIGVVYRCSDCGNVFAPRR